MFPFFVILYAESESATTPPTSSHIGPAEQPGSGNRLTALVGGGGGGGGEGRREGGE